ncbi:MAG: hypothetical protein DLM70_05240 [Chloroflexi bacterium]|nr:MAG: hypothetical protein DLM70_05240 [Chloroflexota bacterium]
MYPLAMSAAVVISGEHWFLDVVGALVTVFVAAAAVIVAERLRGTIRTVVHSVGVRSAVATLDSQ